MHCGFALQSSTAVLHHSLNWISNELQEVYIIDFHWIIWTVQVVETNILGQRRTLYVEPCCCAEAEEKMKHGHPGAPRCRPIKGVEFTKWGVKFQQRRQPCALHCMLISRNVQVLHFAAEIKLKLDRVVDRSVGNGGLSVPPKIFWLKALSSKWMLSLAPSIELLFLHGDRCRGGGRWNCSVTTQSYTNALSPKGLVFLPFAMETLGGLHSGAVTQVKQLAATLARCKGSNESEVTSQLFGRLSLALMLSWTQ